jgi:hypothetical protein
MDNEQLIKIREQIKICQKEIRNLLDMTFQIPPFNDGWGSLYPSECQRLLQTMDIIYEVEIKGIKILDKQ